MELLRGYSHPSRYGLCSQQCPGKTAVQPLRFAFVIAEPGGDLPGQGQSLARRAHLVENEMDARLALPVGHRDGVSVFKGEVEGSSVAVSSFNRRRIASVWASESSRGAVTTTTPVASSRACPHRGLVGKASKIVKVCSRITRCKVSLVRSSAAGESASQLSEE